MERNSLPDFSTVCSRIQGLKMSIWRQLLQLSAELYKAGEVQAIEAIG